MTTQGNRTQRKTGECLSFPKLLGVVVVMLCVWLPETDISAKENNANKQKENVRFRYDMEEGKRWRDTYQWKVFMEGKVPSKAVDEGQGFGKSKLKISFEHELVTDCVVKEVSSSGFVVTANIQTLKLTLDTPIVQVNYDSDQDQSGIYHRILGKLVNKDFTVMFDRKGNRTGTEGLQSSLKAARKELPERKGMQIFEYIINFFLVYLSKDGFVPMITRGWYAVPDVTKLNTRLSRKNFQIVSPLKMVAHKRVTSDTEILYEALDESKLRGNVYPQIQFMNWRIIREGKNDPDGTFLLSEENGVERLNVQSEFGGAEGNRGTAELQFHREEREKE